MTERVNFSELINSIKEPKDRQNGKITLKSYKFAKREPATIKPHELCDVREKLDLSQAVFAHYLYMGETTSELIAGQS